MRPWRHDLNVIFFTFRSCRQLDGRQALFFENFFIPHIFLKFYFFKYKNEKKLHLRPPPSSLSWASPSGLPHAMHMHQHSLSLCVTVLVLLTHQLRQSGHTLQQNNTTCARWRLSLIAHTVGWLVAHSFCVLLPHLSSKKNYYHIIPGVLKLFASSSLSVSNLQLIRNMLQWQIRLFNLNYMFTCVPFDQINVEK